MMWGVWATVSGGVSGTREAWLKADGIRLVFDTREEAEEEAERARRRINMPTIHGARFTYTPRELGGCSGSGKPVRREHMNSEDVGQAKCPVCEQQVFIAGDGRFTIHGLDEPRVPAGERPWEEEE